MKRPPAVVVDQLLAARRAGVDFDDAWPAAHRAGLEQASRYGKGDREAWIVALAWCRVHYRAAYNREGAAPIELAAAAMAP